MWMLTRSFTSFRDENGMDYSSVSVLCVVLDGDLSGPLYPPWKHERPDLDALSRYWGL